MAAVVHLSASSLSLSHKFGVDGHFGDVGRCLAKMLTGALNRRYIPAEDPFTTFQVHVCQDSRTKGSAGEQWKDQ